MFGFLGAAIGIASGFVGAVCSIGSTICSAIGGIVSGISAIVSKIAPYLDVIINVICTFANLFMDKPEEEEPEELAMKAEKAKKENDISPDDFDSLDDYFDYLRTEIQLDKKDVEGLDEKHRMAYRAVGLGMYMKQANEKFDADLSPDFWITVSKMDLAPNEISELIKNISNSDKKTGDIIADYANRNLQNGSTELRDANQMILSAVQKSHPDMSETDMNIRMFDMMDNFRKYDRG